jgi:NADH:ubiquinone oxidoreductase subunit 5 (subunit L)/multisubunit Na+/H+ antiporter MnhA subunit
MAISGVPPFNGFVSKWMVYQGTIDHLGSRGVIFLVAAVFGSALTLASFVKVLHAMFFGPKPQAMKEEPAGAGGRFALNAPMVVLALLCIAMGVFAPIVLSDAIAPSMKSLSSLDAAFAPGGEGAVLTNQASAMDFAKGLWTPGASTLLILLGIVIGLVVFFLGRGLKVRVAPPFMAAETFSGDAARYNATNFYKTVEELPFVGTMYRDAEGGAYDLYYVGGRFGDSLVQLLRRMHSGLLPIYVSWCIIGLVVILAYLLKLKP